MAEPTFTFIRGTKARAAKVNRNFKEALNDYRNFTYGETIAVNDALYLKAADGKVYRASASFGDERIHNFVGFAKEAGALNDVKKVQIGGKVSGFSALTIGSDYYLSNTAGAIDVVEGTNKIVIGIAVSTTELLMFQGVRKKYVDDASLFSVYGNGFDGDVDINATPFSSGPITDNVLTRDAYFNNLTLSGGNLKPNGYRLFVRGTLKINSGCKITLNGGNGGNGGNGSDGIPGSSGSGGTGGSGGARGSGTPSNTIRGGVNGASGANGGSGGRGDSNGSNGNNGGGNSGIIATDGLGNPGIDSSGFAGNGGSGGRAIHGGNAGAGGNGSDGGNGGIVVSPPIKPFVAVWAMLFGYYHPLHGNFRRYQGSGGTGGSGSGGGGGGGSAKSHNVLGGGGPGGGGGGGNSGNGGTGGVIFLIYKFKKNTGLIDVSGGKRGDIAGNGGNAGSQTGGTGHGGSGGGGGGGGGTGGNGGIIFIAAQKIINNGIIEARGGKGGNGGNGGNGSDGWGINTAAANGSAGMIGVDGGAGKIIEIVN